MITRFQATNYACLKDVSLTLTPLHALVGPNDSGKTTLLNAIFEAVLLTMGSSTTRASELPSELSQKSPHGLRELVCEIPDGRFVRVAETVDAVQPVVTFHDGDQEWSASPNRRGPAIAELPTESHAPFEQHLGALQFLQFQPSAMRLPYGRPTEGSRARFEDSRGTGLFAIYDWLLREGDDRYLKLVAELRSYFPSIQRMKVVFEGGNLSLRFALNDGTEVTPRRISEGVLYFLAYRALSFIEQPRILLLEEPESGLHPARIAEVINILRRITEDFGTQIIMTTHSPLVVNELRPDEVSVVTRSPTAGTRATLMRNTPNFEERSKVYALGELWLAYSNGRDEAPLLSGTSGEVT
jgi:predicted ATPase